MIKLNGSDGFIIYQKPNTSKRFIGVGNWCETDSLYFNSPKFIFSTFDGKIFHLDANLNALKEEVNIYQIPKKKINPTNNKFLISFLLYDLLQILLFLLVPRKMT